MARPHRGICLPVLSTASDADRGGKRDAADGFLPDVSFALADEPTGNLDSVTAGGVLDLFRAMASSGTTVVIATHERDITHLVDRRVEVADGALAISAQVSEVRP